MPKPKNKRHFLELLTEFAKLQLAGNIPFWGTYIGYAFFDKVMHFPEFAGLAAASILANMVFFVVDDQWVFTSDRGHRAKRKTKVEVVKFIIFMSFSAFLNLMLTHSLSKFAGITPYYGQFISAAVFTLWTFAGLRFWVFAPPRHHGIIPPKRTVRRNGRTAKVS
jgi:putative flippase GtrA